MRRRNFIKAIPAGIALLGGVNSFGLPSNKKPNILFIITDQQFADVMSCVIGKKHIHTPHMDSLAETGVRFTRAYSPNPICSPMRTSTITGSFPHQNGVQSNRNSGFDPSKHLWMGKLFKDAGYETAYFGKWHIPLKTSETQVHGFDEFEEKSAKLNPAPAAAFLRREHTKPFMAVASFLGPHEICEWARKQKIPGDQLDTPPPMEQRPPMRENSEPPVNESDSIALLRKSYHNTTTFPVGDYTEDDWRRHIWGYYRLVERVDGYIGRVLEALHESGQAEDTVVLFVSDHGDCHGAHQWNQKTVFYDESSRVPLIINWKGVTKKGTSDTLVNVGTDIIPTFCDFAGIPIPSTLPGKSLYYSALSKEPVWKRKYIISQNKLTQGGPIDGLTPLIEGRMVRSDRYKYCLYTHGERRESLVDMQNDPREMNNIVDDPALEKVRVDHRDMLKEHGEVYGDQLALNILDPGFVGEPFSAGKSKGSKKKKR